MIAPYALRLFCLCLAVFFLVHTAAAVTVRLLTPAILRFAARFRAHRAAAVLLGARLLPPALALFAVAGLCAPSYLWLEPAGTSEEVGALCLIAALLGVLLLSESLARSIGAAWRSTQYLRACRQTALPQVPAGAPRNVLVLPARKPVLALAGVWRARMVLSQGIVDALTEPQLAAAMRHEDAHRQSRDNLKRLLVLLAPAMLPGVRGFGALEAGWARAAEWAADDRAAAGDPQSALALADALVRVARMGTGPSTAALATSLLADGRDLAERVERLLRPTPVASDSGLSSTVAAASLAAVALMMLNPTVLYAVHSALERLNH